MEHTEQLENYNGTAICKSCLHDSLDGKLEADKVYHNINGRWIRKKPEEQSEHISYDTCPDHYKKYAMLYVKILDEIAGPETKPKNY
jgi:hypothetical protein